MSANANEITPDAAAATSATLRHCLERQRRAYLADPVPDYDSRRRDLLALKRLVSENTEAIIEAINADYGNRSRHETQFADLLPVTDGINDILGHLKRWMKPQRRHVDALLYPDPAFREALYSAASVNFTSFLLVLLVLIALIAGGWLIVFRSAAEGQALSLRWRGVFLNLYALMSREFYIADLYSRAGESVLAASRRLNALLRWV